MKKKLKLLTFCLLVILLAGACSKNNNTTSGGGGNNNTNNVTPSNATSYYGILSVTAAQSLQSNGSLFPAINSCAAYFSNTATAYNTPSTFVKVTSVSLNNVVFKFGSYNYQDTVYTTAYPPGTWQVNGLANIPSFTYTATTPLPAYTGYASLPDTIHISQPITISVTGVTGSDETNVIISDGTNGQGHVVSQTLLAGASSVTFPASSLSSLNVTATGAFIDIACLKNNVQSVNNLPMNFTVGYQLTKTIIIK